MRKEFNKKCKICGKNFTSKNVKKVFCSNACRVKSSKENNKREYLKNCEECGKDFKSTVYKTRFCSPKCIGIMKNRIGTENTSRCKKCNKGFSQKHKRHFFCSIECKRKYNDSRKPVGEVSCSNCDKKIKRPLNIAKRKQNFFCSRKCEGDFRHKESLDIRKCEFCNEDFSCNKSEKLRFCSVKCQNEWQRKTGFGKNHPSYDHSITDEMRIKLCECCGKEMVGTPKIFEVRKYCSYACKTKMNPRTMSVPHIKVLEILDDLKVKYKTETKMGRYSMDCKIENTPLYIEVMGEFWHCDNRRYISPVSPIQEKSIKRDKKKKEEIYRQLGIVLYIWEKDINDNKAMCKELIMEFLNKNGKIKNYHSMNYSLRNNRLKLSNKILIPFFEK